MKAKNLKLAIPLFYCLMCLNVYSQNEIENLKKYWNYRDKFRKHFVSIGPGKGEGINVANIDGQPNNASLFINV